MDSKVLQYIDQIDECMDWFDFEKVERVMDFLEWRWAGSDTESKVPSMQELRQQARRLLRNALELALRNNRPDTYIAGCGGFRAECLINREYVYSFRLAFELDDVHTGE